jgi:hypothetical protein
MKQALHIVVGVILAIVAVWAVKNPDDLRHKTIGYSQEEKAEAWKRYGSAVAESTTRLDHDILETEIQLIRMTRGTGPAESYRYCHTDPPKNERERKSCAVLDKQVMKLLKH